MFDRWQLLATMAAVPVLLFGAVAAAQESPPCDAIGDAPPPIASAAGCAPDGDTPPPPSEPSPSPSTTTPDAPPRPTATSTVPGLPGLPAATPVSVLPAAASGDARAAVVPAPSSPDVMSNAPVAGTALPDESESAETMLAILGLGASGCALVVAARRARGLASSP